MKLLERIGKAQEELKVYEQEAAVVQTEQQVNIYSMSDDN